MYKCFFLNPEKKFGTDPSCAFEKNTKPLNSDSLQFRKNDVTEPTTICIEKHCTGPLKYQIILDLHLITGKIRKSMVFEQHKNGRKNLRNLPNCRHDIKNKTTTHRRVIYSLVNYIYG